jgi:hypothetical protein
MLSTGSVVQEVLRALFFHGADYIMLKIGRREKLVHKEQMISLMELGRESTTVDEMSAMTLSEPASGKTRVEDVPPDTALLMFVRKGGGPAGSLSKTSFGEYREQKIKESETVYPEWWGAPLPLLYMDNERVALNDAAGAKISCDAKELAAQAEKMKRDGIITVKDKKREMTFSLNPLEENVYLVEDVSGDFEMAEELVWWAAVGKAFVRRLEENGAEVRRISPLETPPAASTEVLPCLWDNEPLGSIVIGMPGDDDRDETPEEASDAGHEEKEDDTASANGKDGTEQDAPSKQEPRETEASERTEDAPAKPSSGKRARKARARQAKKEKHEQGAQRKPAFGNSAEPVKLEKQEQSAARKPKDDLNLDSNAASEPLIQKSESLSANDTIKSVPESESLEQKNEPLLKQPEAPIPSVWYEAFGPFGKPAVKKSKTAGRGSAGKGDGKKSAISEQDSPPAANREDVAEAGEDVKIEAPANEPAEKKTVPKALDKNAARRAYGGAQRKKAPGGG